MNVTDAKPVVVISTNTAWNIFNFRAGLVKALVEHGYEVVALAPHDEYANSLEKLGCRYVELPIDNNGTNPFRDFALLMRYFFALKQIRPVAFLGYTVKPNVYGSLAAQALGIPVINNIAGLGATFIKTNYVTKIVRSLYKMALARAHKVFFQNPDDRDLFLQTGLVKPQLCALLPGSGINLRHYVPAPAPSLEGRRFTFLLIARMLRDKGLEEYVAAAKMIRDAGGTACFQLLGATNTNNPNAVAIEVIEEWQRQGLVEYLGTTDDVRPYIAAADCLVLPSYREGVPRSLLEAAAMARPIVTTDVVGCREAVDDGVNGFLCEVKNPQDLAVKLQAMISLTEAQRRVMGEAGRRKTENEFDEQQVIKKYLAAVASVTSSRSAAHCAETGKEKPVAESYE